MSSDFSPKAGLAFRSLVGLVVVAVLKISFTLSFVSLIYAGAFAQHVNQGIALALCGAAVMPIVAALLSGKRGVVCAAQDIPALLISGVVVTWATGLPNTLPDHRCALRPLNALYRIGFVSGWLLQVWVSRTLHPLFCHRRLSGFDRRTSCAGLFVNDGENAGFNLDSTRAGKRQRAAHHCAVDRV